MRKVDIRELRAHSHSYERQTPVPLDTQLKRAIRVAMAGTAVAIPVGLLFVPVLASLAREGFFLFLADFAMLMLALLRSPLGIGTNVVALLGYGLLWHKTQGLQSAPVLWHQIGFGLAIVGAVDLGIMGLPLLSVAVNLALWVLIIGIAIGLALLVISVIFLR